MPPNHHPEPVEGLCPPTIILTPSLFILSLSKD